MILAVGLAGQVEDLTWSTSGHGVEAFIFPHRHQLALTNAVKTAGEGSISQSITMEMKSILVIEGPGIA